MLIYKIIRPCNSLLSHRSSPFWSLVCTSADRLDRICVPKCIESLPCNWLIKYLSSWTVVSKNYSEVLLLPTGCQEGFSVSTAQRSAMTYCTTFKVSLILKHSIQAQDDHSVYKKVTSTVIFFFLHKNFNEKFKSIYHIHINEVTHGASTNLN